MTSDLLAQVRDLFDKMTLLEKDKEKSLEDTEKLVGALKEKTTALEEKEKEWVERGEQVTKLETELALLRS